MDQREREAIRTDAKKLLAFFSEAELLVLKSHTSIQRWATAHVAMIRGVSTRSLRSTSFMAAVKEAHGGTLPSDLERAIRLLNKARNVVAHEESTGEIFILVEKIGRIVNREAYDRGPKSMDEGHARFRETLASLVEWATHP